MDTSDIQRDLDAVVVAMGKLPPLERAQAALDVVTWCQSNLSTAGMARRKAMVEAAEELHMTDLQIAAALNTTPAVVRRMITEGRQALRHGES